MLTSLLRSRTLIGFVLTLLLVAAIFLYLLAFYAQRIHINELLFAHWAFRWLENTSELIPYLCVGVASATAFLSRWRSREVRAGLSNSNLTMVALVSIIGVQWRPLLTRPDVLVAALLTTGLFILLFSTYKRESVLSEMFHIGLLLGLSAIFVGQIILLVTSVAFSLLVLRTGNWKEWTVFLLGILMTVVFISLVLVWSETPLLAFVEMIQSSWVGSLSSAHISSGHMVLSIPVILGASSVFRDLTAGTVHERNIALVNVGWVAGVLMMVLILGLGWQMGLTLTAFPLATFIARTLEKTTRWWVADLLLLLLIIAPFLSSLWQL